jgi:hypothetical protein
VLLQRSFETERNAGPRKPQVSTVVSPTSKHEKRHSQLDHGLLGPLTDPTIISEPVNKV